MNDHVVDGTELKDYLQSQYDIHAKVINDDSMWLYGPFRKSQFNELKGKYINLAKKFKVVLDLHD